MGNAWRRFADGKPDEVDAVFALRTSEASSFGIGETVVVGGHRSAHNGTTLRAGRPQLSADEPCRLRNVRKWAGD
jgi:hypothetical protein